MEALLLKVPDVARQLGVSRAKVYELMARGLLPSVKLDGCRRVRSEDLRAFTSNLEASWPDARTGTGRGGT
jgi:excisionase family DNA binding protein